MKTKSLAVWLLAAATTALPAAPIEADVPTATIEWSIHAHANSGSLATIKRQGGPFFTVNGLPTATYTLSTTKNPDGSSDAKHAATFTAAILRPKVNEFIFHYTVENGAIGILDHVVRLLGLGDTPIPLFEGHRVGSEYTGRKQLTLELKEIYPELAKHLEELGIRLRDEIARTRAVTQGADHAGANVTRLERLIKTIDALSQRSFDEITADHLDSILKEYADLLPNLGWETRKVVEGYKIGVAALRAEIKKTSARYQAWTDELSALARQHNAVEARAAEARALRNLPRVAVPSVMAEPFAADKDAYDAFAEQTISRLRACVDEKAGVVTNRRGFLDVFEEWKLTNASIDRALRLRASVRTEEYGAFQSSTGKVQAFVRHYFSDSGWFRDIDTAIEGLVDGGLRDRSAAKAARIKHALNRLELSGPEAAVAYAWLAYIHEMGQAVGRAKLSVLEKRLAAEERSLWDSTVAFLETAATVGWTAALATTPLGDLVDICEAISGREGCNLIDGRELEWESRVFSAMGVFSPGNVGAATRLAIDAVRISKRARRADRLRVVYEFDTDVFMARVDEVRRTIRKRTVGKNAEYLEAESSNGINVYRHTKHEWKIAYDELGFPLFGGEHLHPSFQDLVWVVFGCDRDLDSSSANKVTGFNPKTEKERYTWHHSHHFRNRNGKVEVAMQLVRKEVHDWAQHVGGMSVGKEIYGKENCR